MRSPKTIEVFGIKNIYEICITEDDCRSTEYTDARRLFSDGDGRTVIQNLPIWFTPARTHSICGLKSRVLKLTFWA